MASADDISELAPTGTLRAGVVTAPAASAFFAVRDDQGAVHGVTVALLRALADKLSLPLDLQVYDNSGQVTDAVASGACDVAFMPHDAERAKKVDFGPAYFLIESTYLVPAGSAIQSIAEVNKPGVRVVDIDVPSVDKMTDMARKGEGDAFALTHDSLAGLMPKVPGGRILPGNFQQTGIAVAVPKGRAAALKLASAWLEEAKTSGVVRGAFDAAGFKDAAVAP
jgi:polar amino acid transport system substrate-binding protein